ncbi:MAG TPA: ankyrin repeat domain-containing protein [Hyphomicrobiaceae bacterium]|nr:ankyrin repeat domain-containing protein [Hyphomicrobiaceae bacterium]
MSPPRTYRYYIRSPDGRAIFGVDILEAAQTVALEYGPGAQLVDTLAQAYHPMVQEVVEANDGKSLVYAPIGGWDTGRFTPERDLIEAIKKGSVAIAHAFIAKGASSNAKDAMGGSALHWAVGRGNLDIVTLLIANGADVNARDAKAQTPLDVALAKGRHTIADRLRQAGAGYSVLR